MNSPRYDSIRVKVATSVLVVSLVGSVIGVRAESNKLNFDQGINASDVLEKARSAAKQNGDRIQDAHSVPSMHGSPDTAYEYPVKPGTKEWKAFSSSVEMRKACQVPETSLHGMSTPALIESVLNYPLFGDMHLYNSLQKGFEAVTARFNGIQELLKRRDAGSVLLARYRTMDPAAISQRSTSVEKGAFVWSFNIIEILLAQDAIQASMTEPERRKLRTDALAKYKIKKAITNASSGYGADSLELGLLLADGRSPATSALRSDTPATDVETPRGSPVDNAWHYDEAPQNVLDQAEAYVVKQFPDAIRLAPATRKYNCHSYAWWNQTASSNTVWINSPGQRIFWEDGSYYRWSGRTCGPCTSAGCNIELNSQLWFDSSGACVGETTFNGEVVPGGKVAWEIITSGGGSKNNLAKGVAATSDLKGSRNPKPTPTHSCKVKFNGERLELKKPNNYARITYQVREDCSVALDSVVYSAEGPSMDQGNPNASERGVKASKDMIARSSLLSKASYSCTLNGWEEDAAGARMVTMQNETIWNTDADGITDGTVYGYAYTDLPWWYIPEKPAVDIYFTSAYDGISYAKDGFYCKLPPLTHGMKLSYSKDDHSAIYVSGDDPSIKPESSYCRSKWGMCPLVEHKCNYSPYDSTGIAVYTPSSE